MLPILKRLLQTHPILAPLILRVSLGAVILPHGLQKTVGAFGGHGLGGTIQFFQSHLGVPAPLALLAVAAESLGALMLFLGLGTRIAAFGIGTTMLVAAILVHTPNGFFMNWMGNQAGEGYEFHLLAMGMAVALMISGGGAGSLDHLLMRRQRN